MRVCQAGLAVVLLVSSLFSGGNVCQAADLPSVTPDTQGFIQPFILTFERNEALVIVFPAKHPVYEAIEVMVNRRAGQPPLLRAIITRHDKFQIDHINDVQLARDRAELLSGRKTVYRPIQYEQREAAGIVTSRLRFKSYRGEDIDLHFQSIAPVATEPGGFIDPGGHSKDDALPVMWADAGAFASPRTLLTIDGATFPLKQGPQPGSLQGIYFAGFRIGVVYEGSLTLYPLGSPRRFAEGEKWVYMDNLGSWHVYEIIAVTGDELTIHKTTTSPALLEEFITARREGDELRLLRVRATGLQGRGSPLPPSPQGFTLDLSEGGRFALSVDEHARLMTGSVFLERGPRTEAWILRPEQPEWAIPFVVRATVTRLGSGFALESMVGEPVPGSSP
ncbi:hypothetical protein [Cystobacter fuscus]|uniref:hypothetical protein n=1 Tax=Cystobacter fuscus TaxID=43 RepID=UPI002B2A5AE6|nr:hypothetical protein F0U63_37650 [Cystobacter fuscus]